MRNPASRLNIRGMKSIRMSDPDNFVEGAQGKGKVEHAFHKASMSFIPSGCRLSVKRAAM